MNQSNTPVVSVVIPTLNAENTIGQLIDTLRTQTIQPAQILIVDSSSTDSTVDIVRSRGIEPIIITREEFNHGRTRNMAVELVDTEVVIFMTQDALPCNRFLIERLLSPLNEPAVVATYARQLPRQDAPPIERFLRDFNYPPLRQKKHLGLLKQLGIKTFFFSNVCSAVLKRAFHEVGGFPEDIPLNEDMLLAYRLIKKGYSVVYEPSAMVYHSHMFTTGQRFRRYYRIGLSLSISGVYKEAGYTSEGIRYFKEGIRFLINANKPLHIVPFLFDTIVRYIAFNLGIIRGKLSDHPI